MEYTHTILLISCYLFASHQTIAFLGSFLVMKRNDCGKKRKVLVINQKTNAHGGKLPVVGPIVCKSHWKSSNQIESRKVCLVFIFMFFFARKIHSSWIIWCWSFFGLLCVSVNQSQRNENETGHVHCKWIQWIHFFLPFVECVYATLDLNL